MIRLTTAAGIALIAGLCATPLAAQQNQQQGEARKTPPATGQQAEQQQQQQSPQQSQQQSQQQQELSQAGRACVDQLQKVDRQLAEMGYGRAGPSGFGIYGTPYRGTRMAGEQGTEALNRPLQATPRADMRALMRAGYVMAQTGNAQVCQQIAQAAQDLGDRYQAALEEGGDGMAKWRGTYLGEATSVTQLDRPLEADQILGSDVRNLEDRDLGDISDVVIGQDGQISYVIVQTGGFLGFGEEAVPVPWSDLKVTAAPYRDTFVLDVNQQTFSEAPRMQDGTRKQLAGGQGSGNIDSFWDKNLPDEG